MLDTVITFWLLGVVFAAIYDVFRFLRLVFVKKAICFVIDFMYFVIVSVLFFVALLGYNNGMVRFYYVFLTLGGFLLYIFTLFRLSFRLERSVALIIRKTLKNVLHFINRVYYNIFVSSRYALHKKKQKGAEAVNEGSFSEDKAE